MTDTAITISDGLVGAIDFGGTGPDVLLVHGSGHNAAAWTDVASRLVAHCHPVAVDLRGHGQTLVDSTDPEQYWRDLAEVVDALGWDRPVLVGHSTGGYAVTAVTAAGLVDPAAICVVDGVVLDDRATSATANAAWSEPEALGRLEQMFDYGRHVDVAGLDGYVEQRVERAATDWLDAGARPDLVRAVVRRSLVLTRADWMRRPTTEEIGTVCLVDPEREIFPSVDVYQRITCPMTIVLAGSGFYADRRDEVAAVVAAGPGRMLREVPSNHNLPMTRPDLLADCVVDLVDAVCR